MIYPAFWNRFFLFSGRVCSPQDLIWFLQSPWRFSSLQQWVFLQPSGMVSSIFSSRLEDFLHFHSEYFSGLLEWFLLFFNLLMKNEKEILIKCIYLFTLLFFRSFQILLEGFFLFLAFCSSMSSLSSNSLQTLMSARSNGAMLWQFTFPKISFLTEITRAAGTNK